HLLARPIVVDGAERARPVISHGKRHGRTMASGKRKSKQAGLFRQHRIFFHSAVARTTQGTGSFYLALHALPSGTKFADAELADSSAGSCHQALVDPQSSQYLLLM